MAVGVESTPGLTRDIMPRLEAGEAVGILVGGRWEWGKFLEANLAHDMDWFELEGGRKMLVRWKAIDAFSFRSDVKSG